MMKSSKVLAFAFILSLFLSLSLQVSAMISQDLVADRGRDRERPNLYDYNRENVQRNMQRDIRRDNPNAYYYGQPSGTYYDTSPSNTGTYPNNTNYPSDQGDSQGN